MSFVLTMAHYSPSPKSVSEVTKIGSTKVEWELKNWKETHEVLVAGGASCSMQFENPKVSLRFYLCPVDKTRRGSKPEIQITYYSLCADVLEASQNCVVKVNGYIHLNHGTDIPSDGEIKVTKSRKTTGNVVKEHFMAVRFWTMDKYGLREAGTFDTDNHNYKLFQQQDVSITLWGKLFQLNGDDVETESRNAEIREPQLSMMGYMKTMYAAEDNFSDLKLETKDNMTLSAHKFQLAAVAAKLFK